MVIIGDTRRAMGDYIESIWKDNRTTGYDIQRV